MSNAIEALDGRAERSPALSGLQKNVGPAGLSPPSHGARRRSQPSHCLMSFRGEAMVSSPLSWRAGHWRSLFWRSRSRIWAGSAKAGPLRAVAHRDRRLARLWELTTAKFGWLPKPFFSPPNGLLNVYVTECVADSDLHRLHAAPVVDRLRFRRVVGYALGVALGWSKRFSYWGMPILKLIGPVPATAWIPCTFFFFPTTFAASVFIVALSAGIPVAILTSSGVASVNRAYYDVGRNLGASEWYLVSKIAVPASLPHVFVGLFMALYYSFAVLVVAEMLGAKFGLGWYIQFETAYSGYANVYATLVIMALICAGIVKLLFVARDRLLGWQRGSSNGDDRNGVARPAARGAQRCNRHPRREPCVRARRFAAAGARIIDLSVAAGEFVALLGPSGCGKSTLLRLISGLEQPTSGSISAEGSLIDRPDPSRILVFQDPTLFPWATVWNNVATGLDARGVLKQERQRVDSALDLVGLRDFSKAYPHQLSGGMAQRAALARALVNDPALLLLDEPLGKLDSLTRLTLQAELVSLWRREGFTAILVTHDVEEAVLLASRVIVLSGRPGRIKAEFKVERPYPRHRDDPELVGLRRQILATLGLAT